MDPQTDSPDFEKTLNGEDFDFDFDEDFETETVSEYTVMDAMRFDRSAGTASCNFEIEEDDDDGFGTLLTKGKTEDTTEQGKKPPADEEAANSNETEAKESKAKETKVKGKAAKSDKATKSGKAKK